MRGVVLPLLVAIVALSLLPLAAAGNPARVEPAISAPGATLHLVYTVPSPGPADVAVQRSATCAIAAPDGTTTTYSADTTLVVVKLAPGATAYSWDIPAPAKLGNYTVSFQQTDLVALPGGQAPAQAHFEVTADGRPHAGEPLTNTNLTDTQPEGGTTTRVIYVPLTQPLDDVHAAEPTAVVKFVLTAASSAGSLVLLLLANRFGS